MGTKGRRNKRGGEQRREDRGREELLFWRRQADCHCLAPLFSWTLDFPVIQQAGLLPSWCCYWTKYILSSNIICSFKKKIRYSLHDIWGRVVWVGESQVLHCQCIIFCYILYVCACVCPFLFMCRDQRSMLGSSSLTFYLSFWDKLYLNLWLAN